MAQKPPKKSTRKADSKEVTLKDLFAVARELEHWVSDPGGPGTDFTTTEGEEALMGIIEDVIQTVIHMPRRKRPLHERLAHAEAESLRGACLRFEQYWKTNPRKPDADRAEMKQLDIATSRLAIMTI
jgi:hypothetical protein